MKSKKLSGRQGPEAKVQKAILEMLRQRQWHCIVTHGSLYMSGVPDIFCCHKSYGQRWVEVKLPEMKGSRFTAAQLREFPKLCANGSGVWILTAATDSEYYKLFKESNFSYYYLRKVL